MCLRAKRSGGGGQRILLGKQLQSSSLHDNEKDSSGSQRGRSRWGPSVVLSLCISLEVPSSPESKCFLSTTHPGSQLRATPSSGSSSGSGSAGWLSEAKCHSLLLPLLSPGTQTPNSYISRGNSRAFSRAWDSWGKGRNRGFCWKSLHDKQHLLLMSSVQFLVIL